jgi:hypothetical protein
MVALSRHLLKTETDQQQLEMLNVEREFEDTNLACSSSNYVLHKVLRGIEDEQTDKDHYHSHNKFDAAEATGHLLQQLQ